MDVAPENAAALSVYCGRAGGRVQLFSGLSKVCRERPLCRSAKHTCAWLFEERLGGRSLQISAFIREELRRRRADSAAARADHGRKQLAAEGAAQRAQD